MEQVYRGGAPPRFVGPPRPAIIERVRSPLVPLLFACVVVLAACNGTNTGPTNPSTATPTPTIDFAAEARRLVGGAVFSAGDLPGFDPLGADDLQSQAGLSEECNIFDPGVVFPDAVATADSGAFGSILDDQLLNLAGIYRSADDASVALARTRDLKVRCEGQFEDAVDQVARDFLDVLGIDLGLFSTIDVAITDYDPTAVGDEIIGYRMHVNVNLVLTSQQYNLDAIVVREGKVAGSLVYGRFGQVDDAAEAELLELIAGKLSAVNASLPE